MSRLPSLSILLSAVAFGGFGALLLARPETLAIVGVETTRPAGNVELRGFYGGLELGLAVFFLLAVRRSDWHAPALVVQIATLGGAAAGRVVGGLIDGGMEALILALLAAEILGALVGVAALTQVVGRTMHRPRR